MEIDEFVLITAARHCSKDPARAARAREVKKSKLLLQKSCMIEVTQRLLLTVVLEKRKEEANKNLHLLLLPPA